MSSVRGVSIVAKFIIVANSDDDTALLCDNDYNRGVDLPFRISNDVLDDDEKNNSIGIRLGLDLWAVYRISDGYKASDSGCEKIFENNLEWVEKHVQIGNNDDEISCIEVYELDRLVYRYA